MRDVPFLINRLIDEIRETNGAVLLQRFHLVIYFICLAAYILSPLDLFPEMIFGVFGLIDDVLVGAYVLIAVSGIVYQYMVERNQ